MASLLSGEVQKAVGLAISETRAAERAYPRINKENVPSRAYIAFKSEDLLATFSREYDGHIFRDKAGMQSSSWCRFQFQLT